ncbi:MAG: hypothetical protein KDB80_17390 [Planctomycetes bacterium]|nr:hypothetical protein [Planctomycetota bacterium]
MVQYPRKTNPGVRDGTVQKKHRTDDSPHYRNYFQATPVIDRLRPGAGFRHLLRKPEVVRFIGLLPDWAELSRGLDAVVLAPGHRDRMGYYDLGIVAICAWERSIAGRWSREFVDEHREILDRLGVPLEPSDRGHVSVAWTERTAKAFQLLHIFLHELGHHHDRITTASERESSRGETYAEDYANRYASQIWDAYVAEFGWS